MLRDDVCRASILELHFPLGGSVLPSGHDLIEPIGWSGDPALLAAGAGVLHHDRALSRVVDLDASLAARLRLDASCVHDDVRYLQRVA